MESGLQAGSREQELSKICLTMQGKATKGRKRVGGDVRVRVGVNLYQNQNLAYLFLLGSVPLVWEVCK